MADGTKLVEAAFIDGHNVVYIGYIPKNTLAMRLRFAREAMEQLGQFRFNVLPVVIITFDKHPPVWACPIVQGVFKAAKYIAIANRLGGDKDCTIVQSPNEQLVGTDVINPDTDPAWGPPMKTSHAAGRQH